MRGSCSTAQEMDFIHAFLQIPFDIPSFFYIHWISVYDIIERFICFWQYIIFH